MPEQASNAPALPPDRGAQVTLWLIGSIVTLAAIVGLVWVSQPDLLNGGVTCTAAGCKTPDNYAFNQLVLLLAPSALLAGLICVATAIVIQAAPRQETSAPEAETETSPATPEAETETSPAAPDANPSRFMRPSDTSSAPDRRN